MNWAHCHLQCRVDIVWFILRIFWFLYFVCLFELGLNKEGKCWLHLFMGTWASSSNVTTKKDLWLEPIFTCCAELTGYEASQTFFFISSLIMFVWSEVKLQFCWHLPLILRQKRSIFTCSSELTEYEAFLQGPPSGFDTKYLALGDRNMQVRFGLKVDWESWIGGIWLITLWFG